MIRPYTSSDKSQLLSLLKLNIPQYFAEEELADFALYLKEQTEDYFVIEQDGVCIGCGGINYEIKDGRAIISWDVIHPDHHGKGLGKQLLLYRINLIKKIPEIKEIIVRTSQLTFKFYQKAGFELGEIKKDYWAKGLDLYFMTLSIDKSH